MDDMTIAGRECYIYENGDAEYVLLQPVDDNDISVLDSEAQKISERTDAPFILIAFKINDWNKGNHFVDSDKRCAKAFAWCINKDRS